MTYITKHLLAHVFSSVLTLEKHLNLVRKCLDDNPTLESKLLVSIDEQEAVLRKMRRMANKLQLQCARADWLEAVQTLKIFYGLNALVRPEILATFLAISGERQSKGDSEPQAVYH